VQSFGKGWGQKGGGRLYESGGNLWERFREDCGKAVAKPWQSFRKILEIRKRKRTNKQKRRKLKSLRVEI
jgi:hypothetical protein